MTTLINRSGSVKSGYAGSDGITHKHGHHHKFHGAHHAAEKERLKKLLHQLEMMHGQDDSEHPGGSTTENHYRKMIHQHLKDGINNFRQQFFADPGSENDGVGVGITGAGDGSGTGGAGNATASGEENDPQVTSDGSGGAVSGSGQVDNLVDAAHVLASQGDIVLSGGIAVLYLFMNLLSDLANFKYIEMQQKAQVSRDAQNKANEVNEIIADVAKRSNSDTYTEQLPTDVVKYMEDNDVQIDNETIDKYLGLDNQVGSSYNVDTVTLDGKSLSKDNFTITEGDDGVYHITNKDGSGSHDLALTSDDFQITGNTITVNLGSDAIKTLGLGTGQKLVISGSVPDHVGKALNKGELNAVKSALENTSNRASDFVSQSQLQLQKVMQTYNVTVSLINSMQTLLEEMNKSIAQNIR